MRTVFWDYDSSSTKMIDQRLLPWEFVVADFTDYQEVARAIKEMVVRGAPAIGAAAAFGMALAAKQSSATDRLALLRDLETAAAHLNAARPTAVNLAWGVRRMLRVAANEELEGVNDVRDAILAEAQQLADEDVALNKRMAYNGAELISDGDTILHHCNTGRVGHGRLGHGAGGGICRPRAGQKDSRVGRRDASHAARLPPDRLGTAPARHPLRPHRR
jgi:methylthioribose-1-phosphate isomerase